MTTVSYEQVTQSENTEWTLLTEFSTLRVDPVAAPAVIQAPEIGNGQPFLFTGLDGGYVDYQQANGVWKLRVFND